MNLRKRARKAEHKEERRHEILKAAGKLVEQSDYAGLTLAQVAKRLGLCKGTLYLYFKTKEELFLEVFRLDLSDLQAQWKTKLAQAKTAEQVACALVNPLEDRLIFLRLSAVIPQILEHNLPQETALNFKLESHQFFGQLGALLEERLQWEPGRGGLYLTRFFASIIGLWLFADPAPNISALMAEHPELAEGRIDFKEQALILAQGLLELP